MKNPFNNININETIDSNLDKNNYNNSCKTSVRSILKKKIKFQNLEDLSQRRNSTKSNLDEDIIKKLHRTNILNKPLVSTKNNKITLPNHDNTFLKMITKNNYTSIISRYRLKDKKTLVITTQSKSAIENIINKQKLFRLEEMIRSYFEDGYQPMKNLPFEFDFSKIDKSSQLDMKYMVKSDREEGIGVPLHLSCDEVITKCRVLKKFPSCDKILLKKFKKSTMAKFGTMGDKFKHKLF